MRVSNGRLPAEDGSAQASLIRQAPARVATGGYVLHSGLEKWGAGEEVAAGLQGTAAGAFPWLRRLPPRRFLRLLSVSEIAVGVALLGPFVPPAVAGAVLTGFSAALVTLYLRTPSLRKPGSIWPTEEGKGLAKDVWMLGIGLSLLAEAATRRRAG